MQLVQQADICIGYGQVSFMVDAHMDILVPTFMSTPGRYGGSEDSEMHDISASLRVFNFVTEGRPDRAKQW